MTRHTQRTSLENVAMGNLFRSLFRRADTVGNVPASSSTPQRATLAPETDNRRAQTESSSLRVSEQQGRERRTDTAQAEATVSRPLALRSQQNTLERERRDVESRTTSGNSEAAPSRQRGKPSTVPSTGSGTVSKRGSHQDYLQGLPRPERRRIQQEMKRKRKPGNCFSVHMDGMDHSR